MKAKSALGQFWRFSAVVLLLTVSVACGSGNDNGQNPTPTPTPDPVATAPGDWAVTKFLLTNTEDASDVINGEDVGLSIYFILNENGSVGGAAQLPENPPNKNSFTGTWGSNAGSLTISFIVNGEARTISGSLSFDSNGHLIFQGSQTGGELIEMGSRFYTASSLEMHKIEPDITNSTLAGEWNGVKGVVFSNQDPSTQENLLAGGDALRLLFNADGSMMIFNTSSGGEDNFPATFSLVDNFNMRITLEGEAPEPVVYRLVDGVLTVYLYELNHVFEGDSVSTPSTQVFVLEKS